MKRTKEKTIKTIKTIRTIKTIKTERKKTRKRKRRKRRKSMMGKMVTAPAVAALIVILERLTVVIRRKRKRNDFEAAYIFQRNGSSTSEWYSLSIWREGRALFSSFGIKCLYFGLH
ncbi:uncharacterized protein LOC134489468 isoform X1 [Candoia aspera]|uniref:uncharacterized protein LOC134489468 isoform X1 n=1 Tax=Candoia aspera TaxID=51853 RepID=UPI002FD8674D